MDEFPDCLREFANYKRAIQGCSAKTVEEYMTDLRTFSKYLVIVESGGELTDEALALTHIKDLTLDFFAKVKPSTITEYLSWTMDARENNEATRSRKLSSVKSFYKYFCNKMHKLENNPAADIEAPKKKKALPKHLTVDESVSLLEAVGTDSSSENRKRDFCILTLFLNCGMRLSELCGINISDIDREFRSMRVTGKGNKERIIYLNDACRDAIKDYLPVRLSIIERGAPESRALFLSRLGKRISNKTVQWVVKKYLAAAGLENRGYSTHKLRHTAATLMYQSGDVDIRVLKDILGHEQLTTTQIYTHVSDKGMEAAMSKNPLHNVKLSDVAENKDGE
ncbi:MAG: tyrosine-type recombinase/integrase [Clostridia bacterium]|nr:tyrosine-type recombinase/integrase [Clostridia bacterium]